MVAFANDQFTCHKYQSQKKKDQIKRIGIAEKVVKREGEILNLRLVWGKSMRGKSMGLKSDLFRLMCFLLFKLICLPWH